MAYEKDSKFEVVNRLKQKNKESRHQKKTARKSGFGEHRPLEYHGGPMKTEKIDEKELKPDMGSFKKKFRNENTASHEQKHRFDPTDLKPDPYDVDAMYDWLDRNPSEKKYSYISGIEEEIPYFPPEDEELFGGLE